jgi:hypothetical protein
MPPSPVEMALLRRIDGVKRTGKTAEAVTTNAYTMSCVSASAMERILPQQNREEPT